VGRYRLRLAESAADRDAACRLRFKVFNLELGEGLADSYHTGLDTDQFDLFCEHLLVEDKLETNPARRVVGTYRMQSGATAARNVGTIFLDRSSRDSAQSVAEQMIERFKLPIPVLLFPEGTSTDGSQVLRFHSRLIDPATSTGTQITTAAVRYVIEDGTPEQELCWFGGASFTPHLLKALGVAGFSATVRFGQTRVYTARRIAADTTHAEITAMRTELAISSERIDSCGGKP
jgi:hypothetical protein